MTATAAVFPGHDVVDRTSINVWLTPNFVKAVEATQAEGFQGVHFSQIPRREWPNYRRDKYNRL
jgi:hypothetical protein